MKPDFIQLAHPQLRQLTPYEPGGYVDAQSPTRLKVHLASNENPLGCGALAQKALRTAIDNIHRYPDGDGLRLKETIAERWAIDKEHITLGAGSNEVLCLLAQAYLGSNMSAVYAQHAFLVYALAVMTAGARSIVVPAKNWGHDLRTMAQSIAADTRLVFIANPNNPTGSYLPPSAIADFVQQVPTEVIVVLDEAYHEYVPGHNGNATLDLLKSHPNLVITRSFSKLHGLAGLRVGYAFSGLAIADILNRVRQPFNVNSVGLSVAQAAIMDEQHIANSVAFNQRGMEQLCSGLHEIGVATLPSMANFIVMEIPPPYHSLTLHQALRSAGILVRRIDVYDMPQHLRVTIGNEKENKQFLHALQKIIQS